jgi:hypothetical protein
MRLGFIVGASVILVLCGFTSIALARHFFLAFLVLSNKFNYASPSIASDSARYRLL